MAASGADFLVSSAYKWFGPHLGALWAQGRSARGLPKYKVRPAHDDFETGTPALEADRRHAARQWNYLESIGRRFGVGAHGPRRAALGEAMPR